MNLKKFVNQVIRDIFAGAKDANTTPPQTVEMDIAVTPTGDVCSLQTKSAGRVAFVVCMASWPNVQAQAQPPETDSEMQP
jgi:hypothetical protein